MVLPAAVDDDADADAVDVYAGDATASDQTTEARVAPAPVTPSSERPLTKVCPRNTLDEKDSDTSEEPVGTNSQQHAQRNNHVRTEEEEDLSRPVNPLLELFPPVPEELAPRKKLRNPSVGGSLPPKDRHIPIHMHIRIDC